MLKMQPALSSVTSVTPRESNPPYIGVMCIDLAQPLEQKLGGWWHSYLPASYVKQLEPAGAMVIPIWIGRKVAYYEAMMGRVNGILLPGGAVCLDAEEARQYPNLTNDCVESVRHIYELAIKKNEAGDYFPLWGTCLGFQLLMINAAGSKDVRTDCAPMFEALPLRLTSDYKDSNLFASLSPGKADRMREEPFACHQHRFAITETSLRDFKLHRDWHVLATQTDGNQQEFITLIEHRRFPIFGAQFHPERAAYEQLIAIEDTCSQAHSSICIQLAQYFMDAFVDACRRNENSFAGVEEKTHHLICNWQPVFAGDLPCSHWLQVYLFKADVDYPCKSDDVVLRMAK